MLAAVFGRNAERLLKIAKGLDSSPVLPAQQAPRISVTKILDRDEIDRVGLESVLFQLVEEAGWDLRRHNRCPGNFRLKLGMQTACRSDTRRRISPGSVQADRFLFLSILPVFYQLFRRRVAVRRLVLEFSDLLMPFSQLSLFTWEKKTSTKELQPPESPGFDPHEIRKRNNRLGENQVFFACGDYLNEPRFCPSPCSFLLFNDAWRKFARSPVQGSLKAGFTHLAIDRYKRFLRPCQFPGSRTRNRDRTCSRGRSKNPANVCGDPCQNRRGL